MNGAVSLNVRTNQEHTPNIPGGANKASVRIQGADLFHVFHQIPLMVLEVVGGASQRRLSGHPESHGIDGEEV